MPFYAVKVGLVPGIYETWDECKKHVIGYSGAKFKKFDDIESAKDFINSSDENVVVLKKTDIPDDMSLEEYIKILPSGIVNIFVDGSYNPDKKTCGAGTLIITDDKVIELSRELSDENVCMRNVYGEICAAEMAFEYAVENGIREINIFHDYEGLSKWCSGEWTANKDRVKKYKELYNQVSFSVKINFVHIKGHTGNPGNEAADLIAKKACGVS